MCASRRIFIWLPRAYRSYRFALIRQALFGPESWRFAAMLGTSRPLFSAICTLNEVPECRRVRLDVQAHPQLPPDPPPRAYTTKSKASSACTTTIPHPPPLRLHSAFERFGRGRRGRRPRGPGRCSIAVTACSTIHECTSASGLGNEEDATVVRGSCWRSRRSCGHIMREKE